MSNSKRIVAVTLSCGAALAFSIMKKHLSGNPARYGKKWFDSLSVDELYQEREKVRQSFCAFGNDYNKALFLQRILDLFDSMLADREEPYHSVEGRSVANEHGWYLSSDY